MKLLTSKEAAAFLNMPFGSFKVRRMRGTLILPFVRIGKKSLRFKLEDLEAFVNQNTINEKSPTDSDKPAG